MKLAVDMGCGCPKQQPNPQQPHDTIQGFQASTYKQTMSHHKSEQLSLTLKNINLGWGANNLQEMEIARIGKKKRMQH